MEGIAKIVLTGPESTGKTALARELARYFQTLWVPEYARFYLSRLKEPYEKEDLEEILKGQLAWEDTWSRYAKKILFCDTATLVVKVWSLYKYGSVSRKIEKTFQTRPYTYFFLCDIDLPWQFDPMREHPNLKDRQALLNHYSENLKARAIPYDILSGSFQDRLQKAIHLVNENISKKV